MSGKIILASGSPRRRELLEMFGIEDLAVIPAKGEERSHPELAPDALVMELAHCKALEVSAQAGPEDVVIAADTVVVLDGSVLAKPRDEADAARMLRSLSGRSHSVFTGLCVLRGEQVLAHAEESRVWFRALGEDEIARSIATGEPMDKAGAYGAQGIASVFVERLEGDFFNVMGLPLCALGKLLKQLGVDLL